MNKILSSPAIRYFFIGIVVPFLIQYTFFYRFTPNYMIDVFSKESFSNFYGQSVFRYRIVSTQLQLFIYEKIKDKKTFQKIQPNARYSKRLPALDDTGNELFYLSYFIVHVSFSILLGVTLLLLFDYQAFYQLSSQQKIFLTSFILLFAGFNQFVLTPYDIISYFMLAITFLCTLKYIGTHSIWWLIMMCTTLAMSTLNKESVVLNLSAFASLIFLAHGFSTSFFKKLFIPGLVFVITYLTLKFSLKGSTDFTGGLKLSTNFKLEPSAMMGIAFALLMFYIFNVLAQNNSQNQRVIKYFLLFSIPFITSIPLVGIMIEFRLWMPVFLMVVLLGNLNIDAAVTFIKAPHHKSPVTPTTNT